jgi:hypothetical protein
VESFVFNVARIVSSLPVANSRNAFLAGASVMPLAAGVDVVCQYLGVNSSVKEALTILIVVPVFFGSAIFVVSGPEFIKAQFQGRLSNLFGLLLPEYWKLTGWFALRFACFGAGFMLSGALSYGLVKLLYPAYTP